MRPTLTTSSRATTLAVEPGAAWEAVVANGPHAWHVDAPPLVFRGALDRLVGGEGRRRPDPDSGPLRVGDRPGLWVVEEVGVAGDRGHLLLRATVRAPGVVTLRVVVEPRGAGTTLTTSVRLVPRGGFGWAYLSADLPARETVVTWVHRRLVDDVLRAAATASTSE
ncbi:hypothetical protein GCM10022215_31490 [Nocardioides fonticola]|uniref:DUF2867 domain-containing protein n=1 Tax=Nocardioides fonticola TaxID=450363 RepID=A0ABP7XQV2_9ACTN